MGRIRRELVDQAELVGSSLEGGVGIDEGVSTRDRDSSESHDGLISVKQKSMPHKLYTLVCNRKLRSRGQRRHAKSLRKVLDQKSFISIFCVDRSNFTTHVLGRQRASF